MNKNYDAIYGQSSRMRELHDLHWRDPSQEPRLPNEEFFVSRLGPRAGPGPRTGRQLREREAEQLRGRVSGPGPGSYLDIHDYKALCQGGTLPGAEGDRGRGCRLSTNGDPYFILGNRINGLSIATGHVWIFTSDIPGPLHEEVLSESPSIVMFHDFLTSEEIKFMKNTIMSQMKVISK